MPNICGSFDILSILITLELHLNTGKFLSWFSRSTLHIVYKKKNHHLLPPLFLICFKQCYGKRVLNIITLVFFFFFLAHLSTCSRGASRVVMCPSFVVSNFFKHLLLPNRWANLDQTWQECSLGVTEFDFIKNSGCHGNKFEFFKQFFKNLLWN